MESLASIEEIMRRHGSRSAVEEFHSAVNVTFHQFESEVYDELHKDMWESLPQQFALIASDCLAPPGLPENLAMLDIGCGTGLASDSILKSELGKKIAKVDLLDTSSAMLERASSRAKNWEVPVRIFEGLIDTLAGRERYDVIATSSVLHHVPDLPAFLATVRELQARSGVFIHMQDPNEDYLNDAELRQRMLLAGKRPLPEWAYRFAPRKIAGRLYRELTGRQGQDYLSKTNRELLAKGVVESPLSVAEIFAITDIHAQDGQGISISRMKEWMSGYSLISRRSYGFFGAVDRKLPPDLEKKEQELIAHKAQNGFHVGAAWRRDA